MFKGQDKKRGNRKTMCHNDQNQMAMSIVKLDIVSWNWSLGFRKGTQLIKKYWELKLVVASGAYVVLTAMHSLLHSRWSEFQEY